MKGRSNDATAGAPPVTILRQCLSLELEITVKDGALRALAACRPDTGQQLSLSAPQAGRPGGLAQLDDMTQEALFILGHNIIAFDLPHLAALDPGLNLLKLPAVDTLLNVCSGSGASDNGPYQYPVYVLGWTSDEEAPSEI